MIMTKLFLITILFAVININDYEPDDKKAVDLLNEVTAKMDSYTSFKLELHFFIEDMHDASRKSFEGNAVYKSGNYKLDLMGQVIFTDGKTNWTYLVDADEVNITDVYDDDENIMDPKNLLKNFEQEYKVRYISDKFERNRPLVEIDLYPVKVQDKKYSRITLRVDKTKKQIYSIRYVGKDGVNYLIEIHRFNENPDIPDNEIKFSNSLFPGAEIIDMRD